MKTLVFSATYNEAGNVQGLLRGIVAAVPEADILIVDDNSQDGTAQALRALQLPQLTLVERPGKMGLGTAHLLAFCHALHHGYDTLVTLDADGSHEPASIPALIGQIRGGHDFVIGSRFCPGGSLSYTGYRRFLSRNANLLARRLLRIPLTEFTTSFRAYRVSRMRAFSLGELYLDGYSYAMATVVACAQHRFRMTEVPIRFLDRGYGSSKIPSFEIFRGVHNLLRLALIRAVRPLPQAEDQPLNACPHCHTAYSWIAFKARARQPRGACVACGASA